MTIPEIVDERLRLTAELMRYRNDLIAKAYGAIGRGESLLRTARELRRVKVAEDWKEYARGIYLAAVSFARRAKRAVRRKKGDVYLPLILFVKKDNPAAKISRKAIYPQMRKFEERAKEEEIRKWLKGARDAEGMGAPGTFFLLSWHGDSAEDHAPYQGRVYYAEGWEKAIADPGDRAKVALSIARKGIKSFQWVVGPPVYMVTRPYCRHYFRPISAKEALESGPAELLRKHGMASAVGKRGAFQTLNYSLGNKYSRSNVESIIRQYEDRLDLHLKMQREHASPELARMVAKDRLLLEKWRSYLRTRFQGA